MAPARRETSLISKWSLKPDDHKAARVRNNQRRHRARVKSRIETLETELAQAREELLGARARIRELETEVAARDTAFGPVNHPHDGELESPKSFNNGLAEGITSHGDDERLSSFSEEQKCCQCRPASDTQPLKELHHNKTLATPPAAGGESNPIFADRTEADSLIHSVISRYNRDSRLRPVAPGESTTLCQVAYQIIAQQNMSGIDMDDVERWLRPGFRCATKRGEGCRVDTKILYALIDYISPL